MSVESIVGDFTRVGLRCLVRWLPAGLATFAIICFSGCRSTVSSSIPNPTPRPTVAPVPTALPGAAGVANLMDTFDRAVVIGAMTSARGYLTPALAAQSPPMVLPITLGLAKIPKTARYTIRSVNGQRAAVAVTYHLASGSAHDQLSLVRLRGMWRISRIRRG